MTHNIERNLPFHNEVENPHINNNSVNRIYLLYKKILCLKIPCFFQTTVNVSNSEFLNDTHLSSIINNVPPAENNENVNPANNANLQPQPQINENNNIFDESFFKEWLFDLVFTINIWHIFLLTAISCYFYQVSTIYLIMILCIYDFYELMFLIKRMCSMK